VTLILKKAVAGLEMAHLPKITSSFGFSVLTLTVPGLRLQKVRKHFVLFSICVPSINLNCFFEDNRSVCYNLLAHLTLSV
jgi:hypothetical protein